MSKPRVLLFIESGGPGGAESVVINLARGLIAVGIPVAVATIRTGWLTEQLSLSGIQHILIRSRIGFDPLLAVKIAVAARRFGASVIHSHLLDSNFYASIAAKLIGISGVATEHGDVHHTHHRRFVSLKLKSIDFFSTHFVAVSRFTASACSKIAGIATPRVIGNPLPEPDSSSLDERRLFRDQQRFSEGDFVWINVANLRPVKDQQTLIKAFALAIERNPRQHLVILGEGEERAKLEKLIEELKLTEEVRLTGLVSDVASWLSAGDGVILTSLSEAMPMSLLEAMSYRLPVVATEVGGVPELVTDSHNGYLAKLGEVQAISDQMLRIAENRSVAKTMGDNGYQVAQSYFAPTIVQRYLALYSA